MMMMMIAMKILIHPNLSSSSYVHQQVKASGQSSRMRSFKDSSVKNSLFLLELVAAIEPRAVDWTCVKRYVIMMLAKMMSAYAWNDDHRSMHVLSSSPSSTQRRPPGLHIVDYGRATAQCQVCHILCPQR